MSIDKGSEMCHRRGVSILVSAIIVLTCGYCFFGVFHTPQLPFSIQLLDAHTAAIGPVQAIPFPKDLRPGDLIDLAAQPRPARIAIDSALNLAFLPPRSTYPFVIRRGQARVTVEVTSARGNLEGAWGALCTDGLMGVIGLLALWRGRDRAAAGLALWVSAFLMGTRSPMYRLPVWSLYWRCGASTCSRGSVSM